jgi:hypothetical protein
MVPKFVLDTCDDDCNTLSDIFHVLLVESEIFDTCLMKLALLTGSRELVSALAGRVD